MRRLLVSLFALSLLFAVPALACPGAKNCPVNHGKDASAADTATCDPAKCPDSQGAMSHAHPSTDQAAKCDPAKCPAGTTAPTTPEE